MDPASVPDEAIDNDTAKTDGQVLSTQIHHDVITILQKVRKDTTGLSLAMRPSAKADPNAGPLDGVDDASIASAMHLLKALANEAVPKLVFLANLATKHQRVYALSEAASHDETIELAKSMGAQLVLGEGAKGAQSRTASVGTLFAAHVRRIVSDVVEKIAELCQSFMDQRTRDVLHRAQQKREGATSAQPPAMPPPTRAASLQLTKHIWTICDNAEGDVSSATPFMGRLPRNNFEAMCMEWRQSELELRDGLQELDEAVQQDENEVAAEDENENEDEDEEEERGLESMWEHAGTLTADEKFVATQILALLRAGLDMFKQLYKSLDKATYDGDQGQIFAEALVSAQDDLIATALYEGDYEDAASFQKAIDTYMDACRSFHASVPGAPGWASVQAAYDAIQL